MHKHNYLLDCYRILAILMVLSVHINGYLNEKPEILNKVFSYGAYGVALYFIISGYFSYSSVISSKSGEQYIWKKIVRILPMYYISLMCTFIVGVFITSEYPLSWEWIWHIVFLNMFIPNRKWMWWNSTNFFWTMPAFIAWYIVSYLILKKISKSWQMMLCALTASIIAPLIKQWMYSFANEQFVNWNFFSLMYVFLFGVLAWFIAIEKKFLIGIIYGIVIGIVGVLAENYSGFFILGLLFYETIIITSSITPLLVWLETIKIKNIISTLSESTYSVYLTHWFILVLGRNVFRSLLWYQAYVVFLIAAFSAGYFAYRFIEYPISKKLVCLIDFQK